MYTLWGPTGCDNPAGPYRWRQPELSLGTPKIGVLDLDLDRSVPKVNCPINEENGRTELPTSKALIRTSHILNGLLEN